MNLAIDIDDTGLSGMESAGDGSSQNSLELSDSGRSSPACIAATPEGLLVGLQAWKQWRIRPTQFCSQLWDAEPHEDSGLQSPKGEPLNVGILAYLHLNTVFKPIVEKRKYDAATVVLPAGMSESRENTVLEWAQNEGLRIRALLSRPLAVGLSLGDKLPTQANYLDIQRHSVLCSSIQKNDSVVEQESWDPSQQISRTSLEIIMERLLSGLRVHFESATGFDVRDTPFYEQQFFTAIENLLPLARPGLEQRLSLTVEGFTYSIPVTYETMADILSSENKTIGELLINRNKASTIILSPEASLIPGLMQTLHQAGKKRDINFTWLQTERNTAASGGLAALYRLANTPPTSLEEIETLTRL